MSPAAVAAVARPSSDRARPGDAASGPGDTLKLVAMDFDLGAKAFSNPVVLY